MKKVFLATLCFGFLSFSAVYAQKGDVKGSAESISTPATSGNAARQGKTPSKGSPLIQRQANEAPGSGASDAPSNSKVAPAAPANNYVKSVDSLAPSFKHRPKTVAPVNSTTTKPQQ